MTTSSSRCTTPLKECLDEERRGSGGAWGAPVLRSVCGKLEREGLCVARAPTQVSRAGGMSPVTFNRGIRSPRDSLRGQEITSPPAIAAGQRARRAQVTADTTGSGAAGERHSTASQRASRIRPIRPSRKVRTRGRVAARELLVRRQREACGGRHPSPPSWGAACIFSLRSKRVTSKQD